MTVGMTTGAQLLQLLGSGVRPSGAPAAQSAATLDFARMLQQAQTGTLASGIEVRAAASSGVELNASQIRRLSAAADKAEAQGATRALFVIDGVALKMEVGTRTVLGKADLAQSSVTTGIDSVVIVPPEATGGAAAILPPPVASPSLLPMLRSIFGGGPAA